MLSQVLLLPTAGDDGAGFGDSGGAPNPNTPLQQTELAVWLDDQPVQAE